MRNIVLRSSFWENLQLPIRNHLAAKRWLAEGRPAPPPHAVKVRNIMALADVFDADIMVETGTFRGATVAACMHRFKEVHSVEIYQPLARAAQQRFSAFPHVHIHEGDSADLLSAILPSLTGRTLFWLDGHYSGDGTGHGAEGSPIIHEIASIKRYRTRPNDDIILIDDARCFNGEAGYPLLSDFVTQLAADFGVTPYVADDTMFILPAP